jgi:sialate O-acetylesterase
MISAFLRSTLRVAALVAFCHQAFAVIQPHPLFSDHAVLQMGAPLPVWGRADPGERIFVQIGGAVQKSLADSNGNWRVTFEPLKEPGAVTFTIVGDLSVDPIILNDVLVGDVWLGSGQSNMDMRIAGGIPETDRYWCGINRQEEEIAAANYPQVRMFLQDVVMSDLILSQPTGKWVVCSPQTAGDFSATGYFFAREIHQETKRPIGFVLSCYGASTVQAWISQAELQKVAAGERMLEKYQKAQADFANPETQEKYVASLDTWAANASKAALAQKRQPRRPKNPHLDQHNPCVLFNGMTATLVGYPLRGVVWYQGESNLADAASYTDLMEALITDWRARWKAPELPFLFVQLANYKERSQDPNAKSQLAALRQAQMDTLRVPNTGMATAIDIGDAKDIHPKNKQDVGHRLALIARAKVYGQDVPYSGPVLKTAKREQSAVQLTFEHTDGGLNARGDSLTGFTVAGADGKFVWAKAEIEGNSIIVTSPAVPEPAQVAYAYADNPSVSLYNGAGLPALPFKVAVEP